MPKFLIRNLWTDEDSMLQPEVMIVGSNFSVRQDFFVYPKDLKKFADKLRAYTGREPAEIEYGPEPDYYSFFSLRVAPTDDVGHSVLEIRFDNRKDKPDAAAGSFCAPCNPGDINELGSQLAEWTRNTDSPLEYEWQHA